MADPYDEDARKERIEEDTHHRQGILRYVDPGMPAVHVVVRADVHRRYCYTLEIIRPGRDSIWRGSFETEEIAREARDAVQYAYCLGWEERTR